MIAPGPRNSLTDVTGLRVGHAEDPARPSGVTVILPDAPARAAVDARGGGPGTRDLEILASGSLIDTVHALALSGGSAYGLDAPGGVMRWLRARGGGHAVGPALVPIVPGAIIFDLYDGADAGWIGGAPYGELGFQAANAAGAAFTLGSVGAGAGATAARLKGGVGSASFTWKGPAGDVTVAALAVANPNGSAVAPDGRFWAAPWEQAGEFGGRGPPEAGLTGAALDHAFPTESGASTTLAVVATDAALDRSDLKRVAIMAHDGLARAIRPVHTPFDGDIAFALSTARGPAPAAPGALARIGMLGADCVARAIARAVWEAGGAGGVPSHRDRGP